MIAVNIGGRLEHGGLDFDGVAMAVTTEDVHLAVGHYEQAPGRDDGRQMSCICFFLPNLLLRMYLGLSLAEEPWFVVEDRRKVVVVVENRYQALAEEECHLGRCCGGHVLGRGRACGGGGCLLCCGLWWIGSKSWR